jgi:hypothetical protein
MNHVDKLLLSELVWDKDVYPRHDQDGTVVTSLERAIRAGVSLPAIVVDRASKRVVDGWHRSEAWRRVLGDNGKIEVDLQDFPTERALVEAAVQANATHGRRLDSQDQTLSIILLRNLGATDREIAVVLSTQPEHVIKLGLNIVKVCDGDGGPVEIIPAKPVVRPVDGEPRTITSSQAKVAASASGLRTAQTLGQLVMQLRADLIVPTPDLVRRFWELHDVIENKIRRSDAAT